jgi:hypothetical protein
VVSFSIPESCKLQAFFVILPFGFS